MFGRRKARREQEVAIPAELAAIEAWQVERDARAAALESATDIEPATSSTELVLKRAEAIFLEVHGAALIEDRQGPGSWSGRTAGLSIPLFDLGGSPVRFNTGGTQGTFTPGQAEATVVDVGTLWITNQRVVFQGTQQVRECLFSKLIGVQCDESIMAIRYAVSNRKTATILSTSSDPVAGPASLRLMRDRTELALAHFRGEVPALIARLTADLHALDAMRPPGLQAPHVEG